MNIRSLLRSSLAVRRLRRAALRLAGVDPRVTIDVAVPTTLLGGENGYGGWYVATDLLPSEPSVLSLGIGTDISFDLAMIHRFGAKVVGCDPTPIARETVLRAKLPESSFRMLDCAVSDFDGQSDFWPVMVAGEATGCRMLGSRPSSDASSPKVQVRSLKRVVEECFESKPDVLKMDVEGAEYSIVSSLVSSEIRPSQVVVEFHHRFAGRSVRDTIRAISSLRDVGYKLVKLSDQGPEYSFVHDQLLRTHDGIRA